MTLSVVVTVVDGAEALGRCLAALAAQADAPSLEVLVPWDETLAAIARDVAPRFPAARFVPMGTLATQHAPASAAGLHELYDLRRAAGLGSATGELVAMLEDRSIPRPDWAKTAVALHERLPHVVIGGVLACGRSGVVGTADYLCDFARYEPPTAEGPREYVSVCNVVYKRAALDRTRAMWQDRWYETKVHWALAREGHVLWLTPELVVDQVRCDGATLGTLVRERLAWGRRFGAARAVDVGRGQALLYGVLAPVLPFVLFARLAATQVRAGRPLRRLVAAAPACLLLFACWGGGEMLGYLTRSE